MLIIIAVITIIIIVQLTSIIKPISKS
jgi:hypothetical protein